MLLSKWAYYVKGLSDWKSFLTLTFDEKNRREVTKDEARYMFRRLVQVLNRDLFGDRYTKKVGHSYFSYVLAYEYQTRGTIHLHALIDKPFDWSYAKTYWQKVAGISQIEPVHHPKKLSFYVCKYVLKESDTDIYIQKKNKLPDPLPVYWH